MRLTILVVAPVITVLHNELGLSPTDIGLLTGLPAVLFAVAAIPGALLVTRVGAARTLVIGLILTALASAARGAAGAPWSLFLTTALMGFGMSILQPTMPQVVRSWLPERAGFGTAVYMNGLLMGEVLAVGLMRPMVLPLAGGSWRWAFVLWAVPVALTALAVRGFAPPAEKLPAGAARLKWWPDWRSPLVWRLGLMAGSVNSLYFATNFFLPDYLGSRGQSDLVDLTLTALNLGQLPASLLMIAFAGRMIRARATYAWAAVLTIAGLAGTLLLEGFWVPLAASLFGFATTLTFVLAFALPSLLADIREVPRVSAGMLTISYSFAMLTPVAGGALWQASGHPLLAFLPILLWPIVTAVMAWVIDLKAPPGGGAHPPA
jgi:CP family cyanate transporter-like MFS transporter